MVLKTVIAVLMNYPDYLPPDFHSDFLQGRQAHFYGNYQYAFYAHIFSGPFALVAGLVLMNSRFRTTFPVVHRRLGRVQSLCVLLLVVPSGILMAQYAVGGFGACLAFSVLSLATGWTVAMGWYYAIRRNFQSHQRWMTRCFVLLCSAVVIRVMGGAATTLSITWSGFDVVSAWACWVIPWLSFELFYNSSRRHRSGTPSKAVV